MADSVSLVIPTYNGAAYIADALESVWSQSRLPDELIVVDDCSTDNTVSIVERLRPSSPVSLTVVRLSANSGGPARPINAGIRIARGEYIAVLDQDDLLLPDKIGSQLQVLRDHPSVAVAASLCGRVKNPDRPFQSADTIQFLQTAADHQVGDAWIIRGRMALTGLLRRGNYLYGYPAFMFRRSWWERKGGVDESLRISSDYEFLVWLCTQGDLAVVLEPQYVRRLHGHNVTRASILMDLDVARVRARYLPQSPEVLADVDAARELRDWFASQAYWARELGFYRAAVSYYRLQRRLWGWRRTDVLNLLKLLPHWILRRSTDGPPRSRHAPATGGASGRL
jgi:glycosyltransferase involved in cell wall biosynthesis